MDYEEAQKIWNRNTSSKSSYYDARLNLNERARDDLIIGANALIENCSFNDLSEVVYFFEKPHKYKLELEELGFEVEE